MGFSLGENDGTNEGTSQQTEKESDHPVDFEDLHEATDDQSASPDVSNASEVKQSDSDSDITNASDRDKDHTVFETEVSEMTETKDTATTLAVDPSFQKVTESVSVSEGVQIPELKTTFETTFDAVISSEDITRKVTPHEEEESKDLETPLEADGDVKEETPLLSYSDEVTNTPADDTVKVSEGQQIPKLKTSIGTTFDAVITNAEITPKVTPYDEEDSEDMESPPGPPHGDVKEETPLLSFSKDNKNTPTDETAKTPERVQIPKLETKLGTTFDDVVSVEEVAQKVTPYEEEGVQTIESASENDNRVKEVSQEDTLGSTTDKISEGVQIPKLKTSHGATFDAVVSNEEITTRVTPYEEESEDIQSLPKEDIGVTNETPKLSFSKGKEDIAGSYSDKISAGAQIPKLKTTLGTTFDAVVSNGEITKKTTPNEEEEDENVTHPSSEKTDAEDATPLLSFSDDSLSDSFKQHESPSATHGDKSRTEEKGIWTTFGDAVFSVVTGGERTAQDFTSEEDDEDDEDDDDGRGEAVSETPQSFETVKENTEQPIPVESPKDNKIDDVSQYSLSTSDEPTDDVDDVDVVGPGEETFKPAEEQVQHQTEDITSEDPEPEDDSSAIPEAQKLNIETEDEVIEPLEKEEDKISVKNVNQEFAGTESEHSSNQEKQSKNSGIEDDENAADDSQSNQTNKQMVTDSEDNNIKPDLSAEEPEIQEETFKEELEEEKDSGVTEELLEDENALSSLQSNTEEVDPDVSTPEPQYSDSIMRLTLLRDHFTEEKMEKVLKLLGLKNLFKVEAMFADLDTELRATRISYRGTMQDIESSLEGILEASENTILDEIEKMLDSRYSKHNHENTDTSGSDEETEILDDFQELAFSLRQKYSTASDSTPLAEEEVKDNDQGGFEFFLSYSMICRSSSHEA